MNIQKIRCTYEQNKYHKKSLKYDDNTIDNQIKNQLDINGYIIIKNFFNKDDFLKLKQSFNNYKSSNKVNYQENYYNLVWGSGIISEILRIK